MPIVIMKIERSPIFAEFRRPYAVWDGTFKAAEEWCEIKNKCGKSTYEAVKVKNEGKTHNVVKDNCKTCLNCHNSKCG